MTPKQNASLTDILPADFLAKVEVLLHLDRGQLQVTAIPYWIKHIAVPGFNCRLRAHQITDEEIRGFSTVGDVVSPERLNLRTCSTHEITQIIAVLIQGFQTRSRSQTQWIAISRWNRWAGAFSDDHAALTENDVYEIYVIFDDYFFGKCLQGRRASVRYFSDEWYEKENGTTWFSAKRRGFTTSTGSPQRAQIFIKEHLGEDAADNPAKTQGILSTLMHEMCHAIIRVCTLNGHRYRPREHNIGEYASTEMERVQRGLTGHGLGWELIAFAVQEEANRVFLFKQESVFWDLSLSSRRKSENDRLEEWVKQAISMR